MKQGLQPHATVRKGGKMAEETMRVDGHQGRTKVQGHDVSVVSPGFETCLLPPVHLDDKGYKQHDSRCVAGFAAWRHGLSESRWVSQLSD